MSEPAEEAAPLEYARASDADVYAARRGWLALVLNWLLAGACLLWLAPLAVHVYSCTASEKWCHIQAVLFGVPAGIAVVCLFALTLAFSGMEGRVDDRWVRRAAWGGLVVAAGVVGWLFVALAHNS